MSASTRGTTDPESARESASARDITGQGSAKESASTEASAKRDAEPSTEDKPDGRGAP